MKKFSFDLQGVLEIKQKLEGQAKINFGIARAKLNAEVLMEINLFIPSLNE